VYALVDQSDSESLNAPTAFSVFTKSSTLHLLNIEIHIIHKIHVWSTGCRFL